MQENIIKDLLCDIKENDKKTMSYLCKLLKEEDSTYTVSFYEDILEILGNFADGNKEVIHTLLDLLMSREVEDAIRKKAESTLEKISTKDILPSIVVLTRNKMKRISNVEKRKSCYQILFHCAEVLSYAEFYTAWH